MKRVLKTVLCLALIAAFVASFAGCAKINYVTNKTIQGINEVKAGTWKDGGADAAGGAAASGDAAGGAASGDAASGDQNVIGGDLVPGTYGGVEFNDLNDVAAYYKEAYDYTKSLTAQYKNEDGGTETFYKFLGEDDLTLESILVDGKENATINKLVPGIMGGLFSKQVNGLPPAKNRNPELDKDDEGQDFRVSYITGDDLLAATVADNGDGTITITMQPKLTEMSVPGKDAQGHVFSTLGDIGSTVASISVLSFSQGDANDNVKVTYKDGTAVVKINTSTKEIVEAEYTEMAYVAVTHANITIIKDKSASLTIKYWQKFPCSEQYLKETKGITPA